MPYLRLYSQEVPLPRKRIIAQKLIDITLRARLHRERNQITVQFMPLTRVHGLRSSRSKCRYRTECLLEVIAHNLTEGKKRAFTEEALTLLPPLLSTKLRNPLVRLLGIKADPPMIDFQFQDPSPSVREPWTADSFHKAA